MLVDLLLCLILAALASEEINRGNEAGGQSDLPVQPRLSLSELGLESLSAAFFLPFHREASERRGLGLEKVW